jgi:succinyl-CoA synthetase alpha subunit
VAVFIGRDTKLVVQGITGKEGSFHALRNKRYGTQVVAGVTPGKAGQSVDGVPVFDTVAEAVVESGANASLIFVPARFAADAVFEAVDAGVALIVCITEGIPVMDMARVYNYLRGKEQVLIGPNCPGLISPGKANVGIIPGEICVEGPVGLVSRSGTLTYQIMHELTQRGVGQSTCIGIGGDPIIGTGFVEVLERFEADPETRVAILVGEIGGDDEERAARFVSEHMTKPVVAYVAGFTAPPGKRMGHAGAIITGSRGTAQAKAEAFEAAGVRVGRNPTEVADYVKGAMGGDVRTAGARIPPGPDSARRAARPLPGLSQNGSRRRPPRVGPSKTLPVLPSLSHPHLPDRRFQGRPRSPPRRSRHPSRRPRSPPHSRRRLSQRRPRRRPPRRPPGRRRRRCLWSLRSRPVPAVARSSHPGGGRRSAEGPWPS